MFNSYVSLPEGNTCLPGEIRDGVISKFHLMSRLPRSFQHFEQRSLAPRPHPPPIRPSGVPFPYPQATAWDVDGDGVDIFFSDKVKNQIARKVWGSRVYIVQVGSSNLVCNFPDLPWLTVNGFAAWKLIAQPGLKSQGSRRLTAALNMPPFFVESHLSTPI